MTTVLDLDRPVPPRTRPSWRNQAESLWARVTRYPAGVVVLAGVLGFGAGRLATPPVAPVASPAVAMHDVRFEVVQLLGGVISGGGVAGRATYAATIADGSTTQVSSGSPLAVADGTALVLTVVAGSEGLTRCRIIVDNAVAHEATAAAGLPATCATVA